MKKSQMRKPNTKTIQAMKDAVNGKTIKAKDKKELFKKLNNS
jgi:antitoxin component of RelBE/YafQ-DinJ toxin-antitoxin module